METSNDHAISQSNVQLPAVAPQPSFVDKYVLRWETGAIIGGIILIAGGWKWWTDRRDEKTVA